VSFIFNFIHGTVRLQSFNCLRLLSHPYTDLYLLTRLYQPRRQAEIVNGAHPGPNGVFSVLVFFLIAVSTLFYLYFMYADWHTSLKMLLLQLFIDGCR